MVGWRVVGSAYTTRTAGCHFLFRQPTLRVMTQEILELNGSPAQAFGPQQSETTHHSCNPRNEAEWDHSPFTIHYSLLSTHLLTMV